jgi:hypothetical protein
LATKKATSNIGNLLGCSPREVHRPLDLCATPIGHLSNSIADFGVVSSVYDKPDSVADEAQSMGAFL